MATEMHRRLLAGKQPTKPSFARVAATSKQEFFEDGTGHAQSVFLSFTGKNDPPTTREILFAGFLEFWAAWLIATAVALAAWYPTSLIPELKALVVAVAYAAAFYVSMRSGMYDYKLRRHCNAAISVAYLLTGEVGLYGFLFYIIVQTLGTMLAGATVGAILMGQLGSATRIPGPLPLTTTTNFANVVCLELFGAAIIAFFLLLNEFINTDGVSDGADRASIENQMKLRKNYNKAVYRTSLLIGVLVLICYQFQVFTFSNVAYSGGLFSGWLADGADTRTLLKMANLSTADFANSVWGTRGAAAALYILMPWVGGVVAALLFAIAAYIGFKNDASGERSFRNTVPRPFAKE